MVGICIISGFNLTIKTVLKLITYIFNLVEYMYMNNIYICVCIISRFDYLVFFKYFSLFSQGNMLYIRSFYLGQKNSKIYIVCERMSQYNFLCILKHLLPLLYFILVVTLSVIVQRPFRYMRTLSCLIQNGDVDVCLLLYC